MMLSPQAARMGTRLRCIGKNAHPKRPFSTHRIDSSSVRLVRKLPLLASSDATFFLRQHSLPKQRYWKSTIAASSDVDSDDETVSSLLQTEPTTTPLDYAHAGHSAGADYRAQMKLTGNSNNNNNSTTNASLESWRINLGRGSDNEWLSSPRTDDWFTGVAPSHGCPGTDEHGVIRSLPLPNLSAVTRRKALEYFDNSWTLFETLFAGLKGEEGFFRPPPHGLRHPQIFYYGHTACLYVNKLRLAGILPAPVNPYFESILEVGVDEMLWDDMHKNEMLWPTVSEVHTYRQQVYAAVKNAILTHDSLRGDNTNDGPVTVNSQHPMWALFLGFEHERIHLETSSVLFRETPYHLVQAPQAWPPIHPSARRSHTDSPTSNPVAGTHYPATNRMIPVGHHANQNATVDLGKPADFPSFGWDNEYGERTVEVPPFAASEYMITNGEFWHFVNDGGYRDQQYWSDDGWQWRTYRNLKKPYFWEAAGPSGSHQYTLRTIFDIVAMPWDWPVDVTYYEAKAYCAWKQQQLDGESATTGSAVPMFQRPYRLLTEAEHHLIRHKEHNLEAARLNATADKVMVTSGEEFNLGATGANLNLVYSSQNPVNFFAPSETGHRDTTGSAWEWTEDHFNPLKGFEVHHVYDDFSTPCFDGKHSMIVGGSFMSTGDEASVFARFHFRPHFLQHSGFRLVASDHDAPATHLFAGGSFDGQAAARDAAATVATNRLTTSGASEDENVYENESSLHMYLSLHYPSSGEAENVPPILPHDSAPVHGLGFPQRVVGLLNHLTTQTGSARRTALDIGCAVGGASFELAKTYDEVDAFDFSHSFVNAAKRMQTEPEKVRFTIPMEADLVTEVQAVHEYGVTEQVRAKVNFFTGDACALERMSQGGKLGTYDGVIMSNLLCRLPDPVACLDGLPLIVNTNGVVVMVTPFSWLTEFTPRSKWLGGFLDPVTKEPIHSKDVLNRLMAERGFVKIHEEPMPLIIREHQRKMQYIISEATGWRKL